MTRSYFQKHFFRGDYVIGSTKSAWAGYHHQNKVMVEGWEAPPPGRHHHGRCCRRLSSHLSLPKLMLTTTKRRSGHRGGRAKLPAGVFPSFWFEGATVLGTGSRARTTANFRPPYPRLEEHTLAPTTANEGPASTCWCRAVLLCPRRAEGHRL